MEHSPNIDLFFVVIIGTFGMCLLVIALIFFVFSNKRRIYKATLQMTEMKLHYQKEMIKNGIEAQEEERKRIATDLHDEVGVLLSTVKLNISGGLKPYETQEDLKKVKEQAVKLIDHSIQSVRRISRQLMPGTLKHYGLTKAVSELCEMLGDTTGLNFSFEEVGEGKRLSESFETGSYRIIQELINNAMKHSGGDQINVRFIWDRNSFTYSVSDNGKGYSHPGPMETVPGIGLKSIRLRAELIGSELWVESLPGKGTQTFLRLKLNSGIG